MINEKVLLGLPLEFKDICKIYPPTVNDVVKNDDFSMWVSIMCISQATLFEEFEDKFDNDGQPIPAPSPFEYLLALCYSSKEIFEIIETGFQFFLHEPIQILYDARAIMIGDLEQELLKIENIQNLRLINEQNYDEFQILIREAAGLKQPEPLEDLQALDPRVARFKRLARERDKVKAKQDAKNAPTLATSLASICCMGIGLTPLNIGEIPYAMINELILINQRKEKYTNDCTSLMLGADAQKIGFKYWIRNNDDN